MTGYFENLGQLGFIIDHGMLTWSCNPCIKMHRSLLRASRKRRVFVIIMTSKATRKGFCKDYLTIVKVKKLIKAFGLSMFMIE